MGRFQENPSTPKHLAFFHGTKTKGLVQKMVHHLDVAMRNDPLNAHVARPVRSELVSLLSTLENAERLLEKLKLHHTQLRKLSGQGLEEWSRAYTAHADFDEELFAGSDVTRPDKPSKHYKKGLNPENYGSVEKVIADLTEALALAMYCRSWRDSDQL